LPTPSSLFDQFYAPSIRPAVAASIFDKRHSLAFGQFVALVDYLAGVREDVPVSVVGRNKPALAIEPFDGAGQCWRVSIAHGQPP
jgi:hypothetical protein